MSRATLILLLTTACGSSDAPPPQQETYKRPEYPYVLKLHELVPVGAKLVFLGKEIGAVPPDRTVKLAVPDSVELARKDDALVVRAPSPCGIVDVPLVVSKDSGYGEAQRKVDTPTTLDILVGIPHPDRHYIYVDRKGASNVAVSVGAFVLPAPATPPDAGERHILFSVKCPEGRVVKLDDKRVGELPEHLLASADSTNSPAYYLVSTVKRCYTTTRYVYGAPMEPDTTRLRDGQVHRLAGSIDDWMKRSPKTVTVDAKVTDVQPLGMRRDLVPSGC